MSTKSVDRRKFLQMAGVGVGAGVGLAACAGTGGGGGGGGDNGGGGGGGGDANSLTFWSNHPGSSKETETELLKAFTEQEGIEVTLVDAGANYEEVAQRFNAALAGGDLPDIIVASDVTWFNFALNGTITPMDDLWTSVGVDVDGYVESLIGDYEFNGQHFALPYARSTPLFYYNKEMWSAAGLPDNGPETWAEFDEFAAALAEANGDIPPLTVPDGSNYLDWYFQGMIWTFGGAFSEEWEPTFTKAESLEAGQFLQDQVKNGHIGISNDANNQFGAGQAAALLQSTGSMGGLLETVEFELGTAFLPGPQPGCPTGGAGLAIPSGIDDARKENALKLIAFLTNAENTVTFTQATGYMPVQTASVDLLESDGTFEENPNFKTAVEQLAVTAPQDYARVFVPGGGARIGAGLDRITTGGEDVETVFTEVGEETQKVYERDIEPLL